MLAHLFTRQSSDINIYEIDEPIDEDLSVKKGVT